MAKGRILTIKNFLHKEDRLILEFTSTDLSVEISEKQVKEWGLIYLSEGNKIEVWGRTGNSDEDLWGFDTIANIKPLNI